MENCLLFLCDDTRVYLEIVQYFHWKLNIKYNMGYFDCAAQETDRKPPFFRNKGVTGTSWLVRILKLW